VSAKTAVAALQAAGYLAEGEAAAAAAKKTVKNTLATLADKSRLVGEVIEPQHGIDKKDALRTLLVGRPDTDEQHGGQLYQRSVRVLNQLRAWRALGGVEVPRRTDKPNHPPPLPSSATLALDLRLLRPRVQMDRRMLVVNSANGVKGGDVAPFQEKVAKLVALRTQHAASIVAAEAACARSGTASLAPG
jgi:hypothetical protein